MRLCLRTNQSPSTALGPQGGTKQESNLGERRGITATSYQAHLPGILANLSLGASNNLSFAWLIRDPASLK